MAPRFMTILTGQNLPRIIGQSREPEPSTKPAGGAKAQCPPSPAAAAPMPAGKAGISITAMTDVKEMFVQMRDRA